MHSELSEGGVQVFIPEGGGVVEQEAEQLCAVTVRVRPHGVQRADGQQGAAAPVSGSYGDTQGAFKDIREI